MSYHTDPTPHVRCDQCGRMDLVTGRDALPPHSAWLSHGDDGDPEDHGHPMRLGNVDVRLPHGCRLDFCNSGCRARWLQDAITDHVTAPAEPLEAAA